MLPTNFQFIWESDFRGEDFLEINLSKTREACGGHTNFQFIWESGFRGEEFLEINLSKTRMACGGHVC